MCGLQQFYLFGGLLILLAIISVQPLSTVAHIAEIGTIWHIAGDALICSSAVVKQCFCAAALRADHICAWTGMQQTAEKQLSTCMLDMCT